MEEVENNSWSKKRLIIVIIVCLLILLYIIARIIFIAYLNNVAYSEVKGVLLKTANTATNQIKLSNLTYTENISELKMRIWQNKDYIHSQINSLKTRGEMEIKDYQRTIYCTDGSVEEYHPNKKPCANGYSNKTETGNIKEFTVNGSMAIISIASESLLISMSEYPVFVLENVESSKKTTTNVVSNVLDTLLYLSKKIILWQSIKSSITNSTSNETGDSIEVNVKEYINVLEEYSKNMEKPTEQEINNLNLKDNCIKTFNDVQDDRQSQYSQALKTSIWQKFLFMSYSVPKICDNLGNYQKENAVKMLKSIENEESPLLLIETKLYLNLMTKCPNEWMSMGDKPCSDNYTENFKNELSSALEKAKI